MAAGSAAPTSPTIPSSPQDSFRYIPQARFDHCSSLIRETLYIHGGVTGEESVINLYDITKETWTREATTGDIPKANFGIASAHRGNKLYAFGGEVTYNGRDYNNTLSELDVSTLEWRELHPENPQDAPIPKKDSAMISYLHYLLVYGGVGMFGEHEGHKHAKYTGHGRSTAFNNEVTLFDIERSKWIWQKIAGEEPPEPCSQSSLTYIGRGKAILLGGLHFEGAAAAKDSRPEFIGKAMILDLQSWTWIKLPCKPHERLRPEFCYGHCTVSLHEVLAREDPSVLLLCGETTKKGFQKDIWHLEIQKNKGIWKKVPAQKGVNLNSFLSYKSTADIACTSSSTCQIIHYGGNVMGNKSSSLNVIEMEYSSKKLSIKRVRDRITGPTKPSFDADPLVEAQPEESTEIQATALEEMPADDLTTSPHGPLVNSPLLAATSPPFESALVSGDSTKSNLPSSAVAAKPNEELSDQVSSQHPQDTNKTTIGSADASSEVATEDKSRPVVTESLQPSSMLIRHSDYPNLTFYDLVEHAEIRSTSNEQTINLINNLGLAIFLPPNALPQDQRAVQLRIIPVSGGRVEVPSNYELHTPLYMLTPCELDREAVIKVTHTSLIEDEEDKSNMVILIPEEMAQADSSITYTLKEADVERRFEAGSQTGEIVVKNLQSFQVAKRVTPTMDGQMPVKKTLYTARMYKQNLSSCIQKDTLVFSALQLHPVYLQCLKNLMANKYGHLKHEVKFDALKIPHDAHQVSISFPTPESLNGWGVEFLKPMITREEIDLPDQADITGLDYPPLIELAIVNDDPYPSHHHTECPVQIVGFCRNDLIVNLTLRINYEEKIQGAAAMLTEFVDSWEEENEVLRLAKSMAGLFLDFQKLLGNPAKLIKISGEIDLECLGFTGSFMTILATVSDFTGTDVEKNQVKRKGKDLSDSLIHVGTNMKTLVESVAAYPSEGSMLHDIVRNVQQLANSMRTTMEKAASLASHMALTWTRVSNTPP